MALKIKEEYLEHILTDIEQRKIHFDFEACACGRLEIKLNDGLYLSIYCSCRKSSTTPDHKLWHINDFEYFTKPFHEYGEDERPVSVNITLDNEQIQKIKDKLHTVIKEIWGSEYRYE